MFLYNRFNRRHHISGILIVIFGKSGSDSIRSEA